MSRRAALYLRISEDRLGDQLAIERQREDGKALIEQRGWHQAGEYVDNDVSAAGKKRRPGFDALIAAVENGELDVIVATELPRLSRNRRDDLRIVNACMPRSVLIALTRASDIDMGTAAGRLFADLLAATARHEIEQKSERHNRQIAQAVAAGRPTGAARPFGYKRGGMEIELTESGAVQEIFDQFNSGGSLGSIADWMNRNGYKTTKGNRWRPGTVKVILSNPRYCGIRGKKSVVDEATGRYSQWHEETGPAAWPGIVTEEAWRAALAKLQAAGRPGRRKSYGPTPRHLLSVLAHCGVCGGHMIASTTAGKIPSYKCTTGHMSRRAERLERYIERTVVNRLRRPDAVDLLTVPTAQVDLAGLKAELAELRERKMHLSEDYAAGIIDRAQQRAGTEVLRGRIRTAEAAIADLGQVDTLSPIVLAEDYDAAWEVWQGYPVATRREVLMRVVEIVVHRASPGRPPRGLLFDPDSVSLTWR